MSYKPSVGPQMAAPNVIPMADIMLVLLIIFMVVTPMLSKGLSVELAKVQNPSDMPDADKDDAVIVGISASGDVYLGSAKSDVSQIADQVRDRISNKLDKTVFVKSDGRAKYGDVVKVVDEIRSAGVDNVGLITDRAENRIAGPLHRRQPDNLRWEARRIPRFPVSFLQHIRPGDCTGTRKQELGATTMGMDVGGKQGGAMATMNVVPLIDILLVLIIIFMVITPLTPKGLDALVPQPAPPNQKQQQDITQKTIVVQILDTGKLKINDEDATWDSLGPRLTDVFKERAEKVAFVKGDDAVRFADVARAIDVMRGSGIDKVGLITANLEAGK